VGASEFPGKAPSIEEGRAMKKETPKSLHLNRETLRSLAEKETRAVVAGYPTISVCETCGRATCRC
jgi:hypothetical protein